MLLGISFTGSAHAADPLPGDPCTTAKAVAVTHTYMLLCLSGTWNVMESYDINGKTLTRIGNDAGSCTAEKKGRLRFSSSLANIWEYCNNGSWQAFTNPPCEDDGTGECHLSASRSFSDPDFVAANIKSGVNIMGVTGSNTGDYGPPGTSSYAALKGKDLATGPSTACAILLDDTATCWGSGDDGELGDGSGTSSLTRVQVDSSGVSGTKWTKIDAGYDHVCGLRDDGSMWCWGYGGDGALGNGSALSENAPSQVATGGVSGAAWTDLMTGAFHTCGARDDGSMWCWGYGGRGQLGHGASPNQQLTPVAVSAGSITGTTWIGVDAGWRASCGIRDNGTIWCWGWGYSGMLGDENGADHSSNVPVVTIGTGVSGTTWTDVTTSDDAHTCGIRDNGTAWCWGYGSWGRIGAGSTASAITPAQVLTTGVSGTAWTKLSAGSRHTCGIRNDGTIWCWGYGSSGQLGNQSPNDTQTSPVKANDTGVSGTTWVSVDAGSYYVCGIRDDSTIWCWGDPGSGVLGRPTFSKPVIVPQ
ncbi:MAG: hypothetical protein HYS17_00990 [Micavibrio aeruginosavorus]|uniref:Regulator of chromosome condensation family protein n=1 Tax=Micavibrio aeruginosavorus TaxID=349221 RepID=A0A7T5R2U0_9BACT|nr:MAG: hypothetical protein HYS17_00990 [Micavibrio aeruginosavorus]